MPVDRLNGDDCNAAARANKDKKDAEERKKAELAHQERLGTAEVEKQHQRAKEAKQQRVMDEAKESQHDSMTGMSDNEENLILEAALTKPSLCRGKLRNICFRSSRHS